MKDGNIDQRPESWLDEAVLFYGSRKAGTTLLQHLMDGGNEMVVYPDEVKIKYLRQRLSCSRRHMAVDYLVNSMDHLKKPFSANGPKPGRGTAVRPDTPLTVSDVGEVGGELFDSDGAKKQTEGLCLQDYWDALSDLPKRPPADFGDLLKRDMWAFYSSLRNPPPNIQRWAIKEVGHSPRDILPFFRKFFPAGKIVVITRNPYRVVASIIRERRRRRTSGRSTRNRSWRTSSRYCWAREAWSYSWAGRIPPIATPTMRCTTLQNSKRPRD